MSTFEYITGIYSIVIGLAAANVLSALSETIKYRKEISLYWIHSAWCMAFLFFLLALWFAIWEVESGSENRTVFTILPFFQWAVFVYMASRLLTPDMAKESNLDLKEYFFRVKTPFFAFLIAPSIIFNVFLVPFMDFDTQLHVDILAFTLIALGAWGMVSNSERVHAFIVFAWFVVQATQEALQPGLIQG